MVWSIRTLDGQVFKIDRTGYGYDAERQAELVVRHGAWISADTYLSPRAIFSVTLLSEGASR